MTETNEASNCLATPTAAVTVTRPDLVENSVSGSAGDQSARHGVHGHGHGAERRGVASGVSTTRYYLSLDAVKGTGDTLLSGSRNVPGLAAGGTHSGTATVTIPGATPLNTYFLLACADDAKSVAEIDEANNCKASSTTVTVTP